MDDRVQRYRLLVIKEINSGNIMYSMVTIIVNAVLCIWKLLWKYILQVLITYQKEKIVAVFGDESELDLLWCSLHDIYKYQIIML